MGKYFGTDGVRGVAGKTLTSDMAVKIGQSLKKTFNAQSVVIGQDTRESSNLLALSVAVGAMQSGIEVYFADVVSTPMIAYYSKVKETIGIMVTASHNPYKDNGIKVFNRGYKMNAEEEKIVEGFMDDAFALDVQSFGQFHRSDDVLNTYKSLYEALGDEKANLSVCIDTANGATSAMAKEVLGSRVDELHVIHDTPDGRNINENCGSTHLDDLIAATRENKCDVGFAFDGDGDRVLAVDHNGKIYDGDFLVYIIAMHLKEINQLNKNTVVLTKMSNPGIVKAFKDHDIKVIRTDVGDKYVTAELFKQDYSLGGENSGHIILKDLLQTGDGVLIAAQVLKILQTKKQPLSALVDAVNFYPQKMVNIKDVDKSVVDHKAVKAVIKQAQKTLGTDSLLLVRPSGTEPLVRVTVSHPDETVVDTVLKDIQTTIIEFGRENNA